MPSFRISSTFALLFLLTSPLLADSGSFFEDVCKEWHHEDVSPCGTPYVHTFFYEQAFFERDLHFDYLDARNADGNVDERELGFEFEWALTDRIQFVIEGPIVFRDPEDEPRASGFGDIAVVGRAMLVKKPRFLLTANLEVEIPTGSEARELGHGHAALAPTFSFWYDAGQWITVQGRFGPEVALGHDEAALLYDLTLAKSFCGPVFCPRWQKCRPKHNRHSKHGSHGDHDSHDDHDHIEGHGTIGLTSLIVELNGVTELRGEETGTLFEITPGIEYIISARWTFLAGIGLPLYRPERYDSRVFVSMLMHL